MPELAAPVKLFDAHTMAATRKSRGFRVSGLRDVSIQVVTTNTDGVGAWTIEGSDVEVGIAKEASTVDGDWTTLTQGMTNPPNSASANENFLYELLSVTTTFIRLVWTRTSGTAASTITARITGKA